MCKKILAFLLAFSAIFTMSVPAFTIETERLDVLKAGSEYQVIWTNMDIATVSLNFPGNRASCIAEIHAKSGTNKISATLLLMQVASNGTKTVKSWIEDVSGSSLCFDEVYYITSGNTYILGVDASAYRDSTVECVPLSDKDSC